MKAVEDETEVNYVGDIMTNHRNDDIPLTILSGRKNIWNNFKEGVEEFTD